MNEQRELELLRQYLKDTSEGFECLPTCNSDFHSAGCPVVDVVTAFRLLRAERDSLRSAMNERGGYYQVESLDGPADIKTLLHSPAKCGCGDIRPLHEFCPWCGKCAMGCCMCEYQSAVGG